MVKSKRIRIKRKVRAGGQTLNHSETQSGLKLKSKVRGGGIDLQHNETLARVKTAPAVARPSAEPFVQR